MSLIKICKKYQSLLFKITVFHVKISLAYHLLTSVHYTLLISEELSLCGL